MSGAFDLPPGGVGHTRRAQKMALSGSDGQRRRVFVQHGIHDGVARDYALPSKPRHKHVCILKVGILPGRAIQPERMLRRARQRHISHQDHYRVGRSVWTRTTRPAMPGARDSGRSHVSNTPSSTSASATYTASYAVRFLRSSHTRSSRGSCA